SLIDIGFDFYFDENRKTRFSVTPAGLLSFDTYTYSTYYSYYFPERLSSSSYYPVIGAFNCRYGYPTSSGKVHYKRMGTAPNRMLVVEWKNVGRFGSLSYQGGT